MRLTEYTPDAFDALRAAAERLGVAGLRHRPFVDHYYAGNPWCKLHLLTAADGSVAGAIGVDSMRFAAGDRRMTLGFATNFHAAQPGAGGYLYLHWMKTSPFGLVFGGSEDTHRILRRQGWTYFPRVKTLVLNRAYAARPGESAWRRLAKRVLTRFRRRPADRFAARVPALAVERITVHEEDRFTEDMPPRTSPFAFRFAPEVDYLNWRYRTGLSFVRYRVFRVRTEGRTSGYVVLNDAPDRLAVAQCDGESATDLAYARPAQPRRCDGTGPQNPGNRSDVYAPRNGANLSGLRLPARGAGPAVRRRLAAGAGRSAGRPVALAGQLRLGRQRPAGAVPRSTS